MSKQIRRDARLGYTTEPGIDPESGEPVINLRSQHTGGHIVSSHTSTEDANAAAERLAALWDQTN